ncbi:MAG TPA: Sir2 family NAD-dependent protein deacetylase [Kofleriaceae bacterium]|nr:Sir2 family NAD-dependent protein deacetylase [Kofleriaceae bacterium]
MTRAGATTPAGPRRELVEPVGRLLFQARSALFITGPGLSAESGLSHHRGIPGLERKRPEDGRLFEAALSPDTLAHRPELTWHTLLEMDHQIGAALPNRGHEVLAAIERSLERSTIVTINVDRLHQRAGSRNVIEMHGALHDLACTRCEIATRYDSYAQLPVPPLCAICGRVLRPGMPLFGESLPADPFTQLQAEIDIGFDIVFAIGVDTIFPYLGRPLLLAKQVGIPTVEIVQAQTDLSDVVDFAFHGSPSKILDFMWEIFCQLGPARDWSE